MTHIPSLDEPPRGVASSSQLERQSTIESNAMKDYYRFIRIAECSQNETHVCVDDVLVPISPHL